MDWDKKEKENMSKKRKIKFMVDSGPDPRTSGLSGSYSNGWAIETCVWSVLNDNNNTHLYIRDSMIVDTDEIFARFSCNLLIYL